MLCEPFAPPDLAIPDDPDRPKGLHVSQIITDMVQAVDPRYKRQLEMPWLKITSGLAYERAIATAIQHILPGESFRPHPVKKDGIWVSPDNIVIEPYRGREFKLTWYSMKKPFPDHDVYWVWVVQMLAYAYVFGLTEFEIWVLYVNGNYPWGVPTPVLQPYLLVFTEQEKWENWFMLVQHAKAKGWL